jgi:hypothetical protein
MKAAAKNNAFAPALGDVMETVFTDYFRCPGDIGKFSPSPSLSREVGYFLFHDTICYGRCEGALPSSRIAAKLPDVSQNVVYQECALRLPFDLSEVVGNLRLERYAQGSRDYVELVTAASLVRATYYFIRPILPVAVRKHLQKIYLTGWERIAFPRWPVDSSVDDLLQRAMLLLLKARGGHKIPFIWFWPDGASGCSIITHDVEGPSGAAFSGALMDLDESYGFKSAFQVVPEGRNYACRPLIDQLRSRGFEANLHDLNHDGYLFHDRREFLKRAEQINRYARDFGCVGFRAGAMYRNQAWAADLEFAYDMSVPNVAHLEPQRGGCCTIMPYFLGEVLELPLTTIQDYSLFHILGDYSTTLWKEQIDLILQKHGLITVLTHPDYLIDSRARSVYADLLKYLRDVARERNVWAALPGDVDHWWRSRRSMTLCSEGGRWRIEGPGSERARVAYAVLEDDRLVYQMENAGS